MSKVKHSHADADVDLFRHLNHTRFPGLARLISWPTNPGIQDDHLPCRSKCDMPLDEKKQTMEARDASFADPRRLACSRVVPCSPSDGHQTARPAVVAPQIPQPDHGAAELGDRLRAKLLHATRLSFSCFCVL